MDQPLDLPAVEYAGRSDPGRDPSKQVNEDAYGHRETRFGHLCVVCDGMGGHAAGREAAELALATIFETFEQAADAASPSGVLRAAVEEASRRVYAMPTSEAGGRPGSTVVAVLMHARGTEVAHIGDSRTYLLHEGQIARITRDHSIVQEMVDRGLITLQQAAQHPDANRITRALGMAAEVEAELRPQPVHHVTGDAFVLCSDGLSDLVEDQEILEIVGDVPAAQAVGKLVDLANARGGHDNITVLVLRARTTAIAIPGSGIAPTVAQTSVSEGPTLIERSRDVGDRSTEVMSARPPPPGEPAPALASLASAPLEPTMPPTPARPARAPSGPIAPISPALVVGLAIGGVAIAVVSAILAIHIADRKRDAASSDSAQGAAPAPPLPVDGGIDGGGHPNPTALVPQSAEVPAPSTPSGEPIAPLEQGPELHPIHPKKKKL